MKHPLVAVRSVKSAVVGSILLMIPYLLLLHGREILGPLPTVYAVMLTVYLLPLALCMVTMICGTLPMLIGLVTALSTITTLMGTTGLALCALYALPVVGAFLVLVQMQVPFKKSCPIMIWCSR